MERSNLVSHALKELSLAYDRQPELLAGVNIPAVLAAVQEFSGEGHSGGSAPYGIAITAGGVAQATNEATANVLRTVLSFLPLSPLTGADEEWGVIDYDDRMHAQNVRCGRVFKRRDGTAWDGEAVVFRDPDGSAWNTSESARDVTFPYVPATQVVDRAAA